MGKKISNSQQRIQELMSYYHLNQTELCNRTGIQKSALSNYLNGDREPRQDQISLIVDPFNINPAWLMGYDVPMFFPQYEVEYEFPNEDKRARRLIEYYKNVSPDVQDAVELLLKNSQQKK